MDKDSKVSGHQFGFYDPESKQFYVIPAKNEEEFKAFLACINSQT